MTDHTSTMAQRVAEAAGELHELNTGHHAAAVTAVLNGETLVITLQDALSPAEKVLARSVSGAAQVQEFHRQLFANSFGTLRQEIGRITGVAVREAVGLEAKTAFVVHAFSSGTMVQVFLLEHSLPSDVWNAPGPQPIVPIS